MATISKDITLLRFGSITQCSWGNMSSGDVGEALEIYSRVVSMTLQVVGNAGNFGDGALTLQGSNDGTNWNTLHDAFGNTIVLTASAMVLIAEYPRYIRPSLSGTTANGVDVNLVYRP